jgi:nucleotide-binding universal stress UspA family protein
MLYERILVGTDGSATAARAVGRAVDLAEAAGSALTIATVGSGPRAAEIVVQAAARHAGRQVRITTEVHAGDAAAVLVDVAERDGYDLLVVGNKGMTGTARFFLGSVPNKVSHHVRCSLLIVHTN